MFNIKKYKVSFSFILILSMCLSTKVNGQEYHIGRNDVLQISFWQQADLNTQVTVNQKGEIVLPVIGTISALGLTIDELSLKIIEEISIYNKDISQASVTVVSYGSNKIYVTGYVLSPGKYTFETFPNLWEAIQEAGGVSEAAMLSSVSIIRGETGRENNAENVVIDLAKRLVEGNFSDMPILYPGDTIYVPGVTGQMAGGTTIGPQLSKSNVFIYGQISSPGVYTLEEQMDLLRFLVVAGGPTAMANLEDVRIISQIGQYPSVIKIDLKRFTSKSQLTSILINPGDTIYIPEKESSAIMGNIISELVRIVAAAAISVLVYSKVR